MPSPTADQVHVPSATPKTGRKMAPKPPAAPAKKMGGKPQKGVNPFPPKKGGK